VPFAILDKVIEAVHYSAQQGIPKTMELFPKQFHCRQDQDALRKCVNAIVNRCTYRAAVVMSKAKQGPQLDSCDPFPVPSYPFAFVAMDVVSLPTGKHPEIGVKVDNCMVVVCPRVHPTHTPCIVDVGPSHD